MSMMHETALAVRRSQAPVRATPDEQRADYREAGERVPDNLRRGLLIAALLNAAAWLGLIAVGALLLRACGVGL